MKIIITICIVLLSVYTISAQNSINLNSSAKSNSKTVKSVNEFSDAKRSRELVLNEKVQTNKAVQVNDTIVLDLFSNKQYKAYVEKIDTDVNGTLSIRARIIGYEYAYCFITTFNGKSFITIDIPGNNEYYSSRYDSNSKTYYLLEIDKTKAKAIDGSESIVPPADNKDKVLSEPITSNAENDPEVITVMVVYTPAAAAWSAKNETSINNTISIFMEKSNLVLDNSNTLVKLQLVHSQQINYKELDNSNDLSNLRNNNDGFMDDVHTLRDTHAADLVVLLEEASFTGGIAYLLNTPSGSPSYGFSLTRVQQASWTYTVVHEIGHNMGCAHHRDQNSQAGPGLYSYSAGSRWTGLDNKKYCSVMTYESGTYFSDGVAHTRIPYFSSPILQFGGVSIGHAANSDNARTIRQVKSVIAKYRTGKTNQTITAPGWQARTFGDADFDHNITTNSGLPLTIVSSNPAVATILGNKIHIVSAGTSIITASQAGNETVNAATSLNLSLVVNKGNQTITFPTISSVAINSPDLDPLVSASSGLPITLSSSNPAVATIVNGKIHIIGLGSVTITASQSGNGNYNAATAVSRVIVVAGQFQSITFNAIPNKLITDPEFELGGTTSSGLAITYTSNNPAVATVVGTKIRILSAGTTVISATQAGNATYAAAQTISQNLTVNKVSQTITFNSIPTKFFGDPDFEIGATTNSGLTLSYTSSNPSVATIVGTKIRIIAPGTTTITTSQAGNQTYAQALSVSQNLLVNKAVQTITFPEIGFKNYNDPDFTLSATSSVALPITYKSSNPTVATIIGDKVHIVAEGSAVITAMQVGNANYSAAQEVNRDLVVGYTLPATNFSIQSSDETCKTSNNGSITINAAQSLNYTATITGAGKNITENFTTILRTTGLEAGVYTICVTIAGSTSFKRCFDVTIKEPKDLAVYSSIIKDGNTVVLKLEGSDLYTVEFNGKTTTTTQQEISLPLINGSNFVKISTGKTCQGVIERVFLTTNNILIYPNPVKDVLNINIGSITSNNFKVDIYALDGRLLQSSTKTPVYGSISLNLPQLAKGMYILMLTSAQERTIHKFIKE